MSDKVVAISQGELFKLINAKKIDLVANGLFTNDDFTELEKIFGYLKGGNRVVHLLKSVWLVVSSPRFVIKNFKQIISNQFKDINKYSADKSKPLVEKYPISDYVLKSSLAAAFKPKIILEIGTYFGWGAAALKAANSNSTVYSMNPKETSDANNPIEESRIGEVYRKKNLEVEQIWADSTNFDYSILPPIDVTYIDGNHEYSYVYKDLENTSKVTSKAIILDDYIPSADSPRGDVRAWGPWNEDVVKAVDDFLKKNINIFSKAYWIKDSPVCILIK